MKALFKRHPSLTFWPQLISVACGGGDGSSELLQLEYEIGAIEADVGTLTEIDCPLVLPGEKEGEIYACGVYTVLVDYDNALEENLNLYE